MLPRPPVKKDIEEIMNHEQHNRMLSLFICLKPKDYGKPHSEKFDPITWEEKDVPQVIGYIGLNKPDARVRSSELGVQMLDGFRSQGYGTEAIRWVLDFGFVHGALNKISLVTMEYNAAAIRVYEHKIGFTREGVDREIRWWNGRHWDSYRYGMLAREWFAIKDKEKAAKEQKDGVMPLH